MLASQSTREQSLESLVLLNRVFIPEGSWETRAHSRRNVSGPVSGSMADCTPNYVITGEKVLYDELNKDHDVSLNEYAIIIRQTPLQRKTIAAMFRYYKPQRGLGQKSVSTLKVDDRQILRCKYLCCRQEAG